MKIKWYGHAAFNIVSDKKVGIIIDPYQSGAFGGALSYGPIKDEADIVLVSHDHDDHNYTKDIKGKFQTIKKAGTHSVKGIAIRAIPSYHDPSKGKERGDNLIFVLDVDGIKIAHMGDLGHTLPKDTINEIGPIDVLLIPVGGFYTIDSKEATKVVNDIKPVITIPMHFKTEKCNFPIAPVEEFTKDKKSVKMAGTSEVEFTKATLPKTQEIIVLNYSL
ncbi:MAG TPA: MBL fold metallo-hydrolase [Syntrophorhabdaceae bacterium]|nr:MBL fold metallo-hydrolase [Syntrophorhabdaceae bacterium]HOT43205.1 MBL fold metallo-hydrolase [Syntrophorhabdaceae bacterium]HQE81257.1 MBL fold metallo-hydrolase [Syntrophorhabdaceae bacterium]